eukprot:TRINITY_DN995_c0_g2_i1.p1 TRINITY_DN995_c0_g2~~TRINITY_DN995_c0_g2_i1.p1  ORF type:complete len:140 (-),score=2.01 TRINITY_DN995_c0_g2_i1:82-456(-)
MAITQWSFVGIFVFFLSLNLSSGQDITLNYCNGSNGNLVCVTEPFPYQQWYTFSFACMSVYYNVTNIELKCLEDKMPCQSSPGTKVEYLENVDLPLGNCTMVYSVELPTSTFYNYICPLFGPSK